MSGAATPPRSSCTSRRRARSDWPSGEESRSRLDEVLRDGSRVVAERRSFGTVCHGAGRVLSRTNARKGLAEEAPFAYKDVERVVAVVERAGLARRVAQLRPPGVVKG